MTGREPHRERLGQWLLDAGMVTEDQLERALARQRAEGGRIGGLLVDMGVVSEEVLLQFLSRQYGVAIADFSRLDRTLLAAIPADLARRRSVVPLYRTGSQLALAVADPSDVALFDELQFRTGLHIVPYVALESRIRLVLEQRDGRSGSLTARDRPVVPGSSEKSPADPNPAVDLENGRESAARTPSGTPPAELEQLQAWMRQAMASLKQVDETDRSYDLLEEDAAPVVNLVHGLLRQAVAMGASDIHLEPFEAFVRVRFRLDGVLHDMMRLPRDLRQAIVARIKIMANLNIAERRLPQDGRMKVNVEDMEGVDVRVSVLPCLYGEKVVLRVLDRAHLQLDLRRLGLEPEDFRAVVAALEQPYGMIVVTGPTGSGKTTTLYSALEFLNTPRVNIVTVEDPVEYHLQGITQLQIKEDIGLTFAVGLRAFLRQDPDIMMVGEIRDRPTADIAVQAALTGHRVLSTLHTGDAPRAITRLLDMEVEPFLVASAVSVIVAQRLVRKICRACREPDPIPISKLRAVGFPADVAGSITPLRGRGCEQCHGTGFKGRIAVFEVLPMSDALHDHVLSRASAKELRARACAAGMVTLRQNGLRKVADGLTTVDEVAAATA